MNKLTILLTLMSLSSYGQEKDLNVDKYLRGQGRSIVESFITTGHRNFIFVDRMHAGLMYFEEYDSCKDESFLRFILVKANDSNKCEFIRYDNCGQTRVTTSSNALNFFEENRKQINRDSIEGRVYIDHTIFYSLYEFKNGKLTTHKYFCKECVDEEENKTIKRKNQDLKLYKFFSMLDIELSELNK